tara:strand:+ start:380 stop:556 length:177 start_codon:yes stop_codon:yes gene_type:complete
MKTMIMNKQKENSTEQKKQNQESPLSRPLTEMEVIDLTIYGEDVLTPNQDQKNITTNK